LRARKLLEDVARIRPYTTPEILLVAEVESHLDQSDSAVERLALIPDRDPSAGQARLRAGQIERRRNRMRAAEAALLECVRLDPGSIQARRELAYIYGMQSRRNDISAQFLKLSALVPLDGKDLLLWTACGEDIWTNSSIRDDLEQYILAEPGDRRSRLTLVEVLMGEGELDLAEEHLAPLPNSDPEALALRARIALDRDQLEPARRLLKQADIEFPSVARTMGQLALRADDTPKAIEALRIAVRLDPNNQEAVQALALALKRGGFEAEAEEVQVKAEKLRALTKLLDECRRLGVRREPTLPKRLGKACEEVGWIDQARGWYALALEMDVFDPQVQTAVHRLGHPLPPPVPPVRPAQRP
jgi:tetratricopeptide (TPR) repeat protein